MYKIVLTFGLMLAFAQISGAQVNADDDDDFDIEPQQLIKYLVEPVADISNINLEGINDLGIDIDIGIELDDIAAFLKPIIEQYNEAGNEAPLKCLVRAFKKYDLYDTALGFQNDLISFINLVNGVADSVNACNPDGVRNPILVSACLAKVAANYTPEIAALKSTLRDTRAELAIAVPSALLCAGQKV